MGGSAGSAGQAPRATKYELKAAGRGRAQIKERGPRKDRKACVGGVRRTRRQAERQSTEHREQRAAPLHTHAPTHSADGASAVCGCVRRPPPTVCLRPEASHMRIPRGICGRSAGEARQPNSPKRSSKHANEARAPRSSDPDQKISAYGGPRQSPPRPSNSRASPQCTPEGLGAWPAPTVDASLLSCWRRTVPAPSPSFRSLARCW